VRSLGVVVGDVLVQHLAEAAVADEPQPADALTLYRPALPFDEGVEIGKMNAL
jgi:hypothetical protein